MQMYKWIALSLAFLLSSDAKAQSSLALQTFDPDKSRIFQLIANVTQDGTGIFISALVTDPIATRSMFILGNSRTLKNCFTTQPVCQYIWPKTAMRSGSNDIQLSATNTNGVQASLYIKIVRP